VGQAVGYGDGRTEGEKKYGEEKEAFEVECLVPVGSREHLLPQCKRRGEGREGRGTEDTIK